MADLVHPGDCPVTLPYGHARGAPGCVAPHHPADDCVPDATDHMQALGFEEPAGPPESLSSVERIQIHERLLGAQGAISQAEDDLPFADPRKQELADLARRVWELGLEILGDVRYSQVDELAQIISDLDEDQPFLSGDLDDADLADASPRRVAERILERLHQYPDVVAPSGVGGTDG